MQKKGSWIVVFVLIISVFLSACGSDSEEKVSSDKKGAQKGAIVVEFKDGKVTEEEYETILNVTRVMEQDYQKYEAEKDFKKNLIEQVIAAEMAEKKLSESKKAEVKQEFKRSFATYLQNYNQRNGEGAFEKRMSEFKVGQAEVDSVLLQRAFLDKYLKSLITDKDKQLKYDQLLKSGELKKTLANVAHILIATFENQPNQRKKEDALKKANDVLGELRAGGNFAELAKKYSDDKGSAVTGGELGESDVNKWVPEFAQAATTLPLNQISEPIETQFGYHILKVLSRKDSNYTLSEIEEPLVNDLAREQLVNFLEKEVKPNITKNNLK
jgi:foldase protein PrsA